METIHSVADAQARADALRAAGRRLAVVPTMGCLHEGHLSLVREARRHADVVWLTIFVNPTQFGPGEDFERYPRTVASDLAACREAGVDAVFLPPTEEMYPPGAQTWVDVSDLSLPLCGRDRPGHFRGVTTVVTKLFLATKPHVAVFGEKDFQQVAVIRRMARDLHFDVEVVGAPIDREDDGVARSSRNRLLDAETRREARVLSRALAAVEAALASGERRVKALGHLARVELDKATRGTLDYAEFRCPETLAPAPERLTGPTLLALAMKFRTADGHVRLIDNRVLLDPTRGRAAQNASRDPHPPVEDRPCS
ncbi:MAG: pantoate--beta-alanine ligase [Myxococcales bacterium]|nr:pantoate--beta-alanine ligase [Myxococcales bacterium]